MRCHLHDFMQHDIENSDDFDGLENSVGFETGCDFGLRPIRRRFVKGVVRMTGYDFGDSDGFEEGANFVKDYDFVWRSFERRFVWAADRLSLRA